MIFSNKKDKHKHEQIKKIIAKSFGISMNDAILLFYDIDSRRKNKYIIGNRSGKRLDINIFDIRALKYDLFFENCNFYCEFDQFAEDRKMDIGDLHFKNCIFKRYINISNYNFHCIDLQKCKFLEQINIKNSYIAQLNIAGFYTFFSDDISIINSEINTCSIEYTIFNKDFRAYDKKNNQHCILAINLNFIKLILMELRILVILSLIKKVFLKNLNFHIMEIFLVQLVL